MDIEGIGDQTLIEEKHFRGEKGGDMPLWNVWSDGGVLSTVSIEFEGFSREIGSRGQGFVGWDPVQWNFIFCYSCTGGCVVGRIKQFIYFFIVVW